MTDQQIKDIRPLVGWDQIALFLQCHKSTAKRYYRQGMPVSKPGGKTPTAFPDDLKEWIQQQK